MPMASKRLHLGWFMNFTPGEWDHPLATGGSHWNGKFYVDMAQALERACFDYIMTHPSPLAALISAAPRGWTSLPPCLQRCVSALHAGTPLLNARPHLRWPLRLEHRHLRRGCRCAEFRHGQAAIARQRYEMADEYVDLVCQLFNSWDPDAVVMDHATGVYADHKNVRPINFEGKHYKCRGPLNTVTLTAGTAGVRAGRRIAARSRLRGQTHGLDHCDCDRYQRNEAISRRYTATRGVVRAQSR